MKERVYLGDWAYNAGIIGFLNIMLDGKEIDSQDIITIGDNYIEFEREKLVGFSDKFFKKAYERYSRTDDIFNLANNLLDKVKNKGIDVKNKGIDKDLKQEVTQFKSRVESFSKLKQALEKEKVNLSKNCDEKDVLQYIQKIIEIISKTKDEFIENDVKTYLGTISSLYGGKSFLNVSVSKNLKEKFISDFEKPILEGASKKDKDHKCIFCGERQAKKNAMLDTGLVSFLGANKDNKNFFWNFNPKLPICEICELIYFCIFAGLSEFRVRQNKKYYLKYYFVDKNTSVKDLYNANKLFSQLMAKEENLLKEKSIVNFINDYVLLKLSEESKYSLANIAFIEVDLTGLVKVYGFNISREKAEFVISNKEKLKRLTGTYIKAKDTTTYLFSSFVQQFFNNTLGYQFLETIERLYISSLKPNSGITKKLSAYKLQLFNILIYEYIQKIKKRGEIWMDDRQLWRMYYYGQQFKKEFINSNSENKINSLAYRLISALRIGDVNTFMNLIVRTYMSFEKEIPSLFVNCINDSDKFCALGYSFVNGLLSKEKEEVEEEVVSNE